MRFIQLITFCVAAFLGAGIVDARPHLYDHLERSDLSLASAYLNNIPADETITKRFPSTTEATNEEEVHHRIDITDREYLDTREQAQHKRQSHYKFRIGSGKPVKRAFMERRTEADTEEDEILPAAALPIRRRVLARGEEED